ncbi:MAG: hypothetical protein M1840_005780 [Geoglossum simile]|nr:MAG: hypothetical protein M1840_005780 [Geoglossum simile]
MPTEDTLSDNYIAELLKKDAADRSLRYSAMGLQALLPRRCVNPSIHRESTELPVDLYNRPRTNAPKPNTRFLRNIIRETDSHNAALRAKEADESRARLRALQGKPDLEGLRSKDGSHGRSRGTRDMGGAASNRESMHSMRRRPECDSDNDERDRRSHRHRSSHGPSRREDSPSRDHHDRECKSRKRKRSRSDERPRRKHDRDTDQRKRRRSHSRTRGSAKERKKYPRTRGRGHSSVSPSAAHRSPSPHRKERHCSKPKRTASLPPPPPPSPSDSDPLTALIGPKPEVTLQLRGRGAFTSSTDIDAHFSPTYNPTFYIRPPSPPSNTNDADDWDQALEALRDRERWKQAGAKRLRDAGFTEEDVRKWEGEGGKKEEDVKWRGKGEGREWDRGKVVGEDGWVDVRPEWGRLKGS